MQYFVMNIQREHITGLILAGGQGSRFDNQDKGFIEWRGKPLIEYALEYLQPLCANIIISCNRNLKRYQQYGYPCVQDNLQGYQGPLAGIEAGLRQAKTPYCLVTPCDSPLLPANMASKLTAALQREKADLAYVFDGDRQHYLTALVKTQLGLALNSFLQGDDRRVRGWLKQVNAIEVDFSDEKCDFLNFNHPQTLSKHQ